MEKKTTDYRPVNPHINAGYVPVPAAYPGTQSTTPDSDTPNTPPSTWSYSPQTVTGVSGQGHNMVFTEPRRINIVVMTKFKDNMGLAKFATFCCFWPLGIFAILRASQARAALAVNNFAKAQRLAHESESMSLFSIVIGAAIIVFIYAVLSFALF